jgi:hypothetical protein
MAIVISMDTESPDFFTLQLLDYQGTAGNEEWERNRLAWMRKVWDTRTWTLRARSLDGVRILYVQANLTSRYPPPPMHLLYIPRVSCHSTCLPLRSCIISVQFFIPGNEDRGLQHPEARERRDICLGIIIPRLNPAFDMQPGIILVYLNLSSGLGIVIQDVR